MRDLDRAIFADVRFQEASPTTPYRLTVDDGGPDGIVLSLTTSNRGRDRDAAIFLHEQSALRLIQELSRALLQKKKKPN